MISFTVIGLPVPQGSKRAFVHKQTGRAVMVEQLGKALGPWRRLVADTAQRYAPPAPYEGPLRVRIAFRLPVPKSAPKKRRLAADRRPDLDKLARAILDALTGAFWRDDAQIVKLVLAKDLAYPDVGQVGATIVVSQGGAA